LNLYPIAVKLRSLLIIISIWFLSVTASPGQVRIRILSNRTTGSILFTVTEGRYELITFNGDPEYLEKGAMLLISKSGERIAVKALNISGYLCDSLMLKCNGEDGKFALRLNGEDPVRQYYKGDLQCLPDLGTLMLINICDTETYIAGVVRAEGGERKNSGFYKTQAVIARTYLYRHFDKHIADRFNLCDNTHCQAFNGFTSDTLIMSAARETAGIVILDEAGSLINSSFHSNCGGETAASEDVWITGEPYLKRTRDPYCLASRNAIWQKSILKGEWLNYLKRSGYEENGETPGVLNFSQQYRLKDLTYGSFSIPLRQVREELQLRSSFFSVSEKGDSVILAGRGYGHGVGLCQEGAMEMASRGLDYKEIIGFYYKGVKIDDIKNAVPKLIK
jgi:stage II sporulation protein D